MIKKMFKKIGIVSSALLIGLSLFSFMPSVSKADSLGVTWTNGSLEAPLSSGSPAFKTNVGKTIGKWYWEITVNDTESPSNSLSLIGIVGEETSTIPGVWSILAYSGYNGTLITTTNRVSYSTTYGNNDVIGLALDLDNDTITWFKNGTSCGDSKLKPSLLNGTQVFPMVANQAAASGRTMNANFGAGKFKYSIPAGFLPYDGSSQTTPTATPEPTAIPSPTATPIATATPTSSATPTATPTPTTTPVPTVTPKPTGTPAPSPTPEQPAGDRALLTVTFINGTEKEYDLPRTEVDAFLNWYDARDAGRGPGSYAIDKHTNNKGPFKKRKDYVVFDKILTFEVREYTTTE
ncbi:SPRY domain-containing protein [Paenibacillus graminis]|uniref:SPRY domain-containing protein n=1 Tax=Paenibacillus graminis TaxID=189425 RepID=UPI002DB899C2|nr:SPRY domain-containing protein [Paenibacillus graminis]MEC0168855.1 hypothetical protein [Paenibacillus graminis]